MYSSTLGSIQTTAVILCGSAFEMYAETLVGGYLFQ